MLLPVNPILKFSVCLSRGRNPWLPPRRSMMLDLIMSRYVGGMAGEWALRANIDEHFVLRYHRILTLVRLLYNTKWKVFAFRMLLFPLVLLYLISQLLQSCEVLALHHVLPFRRTILKRWMVSRLLGVPILKPLLRPTPSQLSFRQKNLLNSLRILLALRSRCEILIPALLNLFLYPHLYWPIIHLLEVPSNKLLDQFPMRNNDFRRI